MNTATVLLGLLILSLAGLATLLVKARVRRAPERYQQSKPLTEPEQTLYWRLVEALPECVILSQVTFSRFLRPNTSRKEAKGQYRVLQNRIAQKSADFLVCLKDFTVVAAVELDDSSHSADADVSRDKLLATAGITVLRVRVNNMPTTEKLRSMFAS